MPSPIRVDSDFRSRRPDMGAVVDRALPHRRSYLGFGLGLVATVIVTMAGLGWWAVHAGIVYIQLNL